MNKWTPTTNLLELRRLGKLGEELGELGNVASRCIIQGLDEVDPGSGKVNRQRLLDELADVYAQIECTMEAFGLDRTYYAERVVRKVRQMGQWEALFLAPTSGVKAAINNSSEIPNSSFDASGVAPRDAMPDKLETPSTEASQTVSAIYRALSRGNNRDAQALAGYYLHAKYERERNAASDGKTNALEARCAELPEIAKLAWRALCDAEAVLNTLDGDDVLESINLEELCGRVRACAGNLFAVLGLSTSDLVSLR